MFPWARSPWHTSCGIAQLALPLGTPRTTSYRSGTTRRIREQSVYRWTRAIFEAACRDPLTSRTPEMVRLMTRFSARMATERQAGRGDEFPARRSCARKLPHRRVKKRPAKASVAVVGHVAGAVRMAALRTVSKSVICRSPDKGMS